MSHTRRGSWRLQQLERRIAPAVFNIPDGDVAAFVAAINTCNTNNEPDTINLAVNGAYTFTARADNAAGGSALPIIRLDGGNSANSITFNGNGATIQRASSPGTPLFRFLTVGPADGTSALRAGDVAMSDLTITGFSLPDFEDSTLPGGTAVFFQWASIRLTKCRIVGNSGNGGAISGYGPRTSTVTLNECSILNTGLGGGGGIGVDGPILTVNRCVIAGLTGSNPQYVVGIAYNNGNSCTVTDSVIQDISGNGIFVPSAQNVVIRGCTFTRNGGRGLHAEGVRVEVSDSTFSANRSGGIRTLARQVAITNTTVHGNQGEQAAGIALQRTGQNVAPDVTISNSTITGNATRAVGNTPPPPGFLYGSGVWLEAGVLRMRNTVVAGNTLDTSMIPGSPMGGPDVAGTVSSLTYSFIGNGTAMTVSGTNQGNQIGTAAAPLDPRLGPLQDNGGPTPTRLPLDGSPLINAGDPAFVPPPAFDQRGPGFPRVRASRLDIGATEVPAHDLGVTLTDNRPLVAAGATTTYTLVVSNHGDFTEVGATVTMPLPVGAASMTWTSATTGGASGTVGSGNGAIAETLTLPPGATVIYTVVVTLATNASGTLTATAQVTPPVGVTDIFPANDTATDIDTILADNKLLAVGPGPGRPPEVKLYVARDGTLLRTFTAYDPSFTGGVRVATADFTADGIPDVVTGAGSGGGPHVKLFDGATGGLLREFFAYDGAFRGGVYVAAADVTGDATPDIVVGAGDGGGPHVKVYDVATGLLGGEFFAYDGAFRGGVTVAAGNVDGAGKAEIITGPGPGGGPHLKVFGGATGGLLRERMVYEESFRGGLFVAAGDVDGDAKADVLTGPGVGGGPFVKALRGTDLSVLAGFFAYDSAGRAGVRVAAVDAAGDGRAEIATGPGPGFPPQVRIFDAATGTEVRSLLAFDPAFRGGVFVG